MEQDQFTPRCYIRLARSLKFFALVGALIALAPSSEISPAIAAAQVSGQPDALPLRAGQASTEEVRADGRILYSKLS